MQTVIFDLDGTLIDTVYAHVFAWQQALSELGMAIDGWKIHRRIGMSGGLFARAVARELGRELNDNETSTLEERHGVLFRQLLPIRRVAGESRRIPVLGLEKERRGGLRPYD